MKYTDILALFKANSIFKATRKAWNNEAYIYSDGKHLIIHKKCDKELNPMEVCETIYYSVYQDITANDWEIIP